MRYNTERPWRWRCPDCGRENRVIPADDESKNRSREQFVCDCVRTDKWDPQRALKRMATSLGGSVHGDLAVFSLCDRAANFSYWPARNPRRTAVRVDVRGFIPGKLWIHPRRLRDWMRVALRGQAIMVGHPKFDEAYSVKVIPDDLFTRTFDDDRKRRLIETILHAPGDVRLTPRFLSVTVPQFLFEFEPASRLVETAVDLVELLSLETPDRT